VVDATGLVSRVLFDAVIYLGTLVSERPGHLVTWWLLSPRASASDLQAARSEIAAGRIALFTPAPIDRPEPAMVSVALTPAGNPASAPIWTVSVHRTTLPRVSPGTLALRSSDFPLARRASDRSVPFHPTRTGKSQPLSGGAEGEI
jgi:hypothetical protein